jgi:hypothetical protein
MAPATIDPQYEHYLVARQNVVDQAATGLTPTSDQKITLIIIGVYIAAILILWNMPIAKIILAPFKVRIYTFKASWKLIATSSNALPFISY